MDVDDREEYLGVKMGFFGLRSTLIPMDVVRVNERDRAIEVAESKDRVKDAPSFDDDEDITPEFEERIRSHFGLTSQEGSTTRGSYGGRSAVTGAEGAAAGDRTTRGADAETIDLETTDRDRETTDRDAEDYRELDREGSLGGSREGTREPVGREEYRNRENFAGSSAIGTAASGAPCELETGDRTSDRGSGVDEAYREGYRQGFREGMREAGGGAPGGAATGDNEGRGGRDEDAAASEHFEALAVGSGDEESRDIEDRQSGSTGFQPSRGEPMDRGGAGYEWAGAEERPRDGGSREGQRRAEEGEQRSESTTTRVWRRIRG